MAKLPPATPGVGNMDALIWRYMDLAKFVAMLDSRSLYFCRTDLLDDSFEGFVPTIEQIKKIDGPQAMPHHAMQIFRTAARQMRERVFVNCWHQNDVESAAMWKLYLKSSEGIAIQSTPRKLQSAAKDRRLSLGDVEYFDVEVSSAASKERDRPFFQMHSPLRAFFQKRKSFEHEREFRAIRSIGVDDPIVSEIHVPVDLEILLDRVVLAPGTPTWQAAAIRSLGVRYDLRTPIQESSLDSQADWSEVENLTVEYYKPPGAPESLRRMDLKGG